MKYRESTIDKKLRKWFLNDFTRALLRKINLRKGHLRGLNSFEIDFYFPIVAIAGRNGAGKSTILALSCCAYHNRKNGYKLPKRKETYYTFSDFFIQHSEEVPPQGIEIFYLFAHNNWRKTESTPDGTGLGYQKRWKRKGGKWNDYDSRVNRNVVFLGIERIVPHSERSQSKSYSKAFKEAAPVGWENKVKDAVGYVLGRTYDKLRYLEHSKYNLPIVETGGITYSGLNMGAGENALFEIFKVIYSCGDGALLVLDEIELGLHSEAQKKLMRKLKESCLETHTQIICTTHSQEIFDSLPPEARFYVERINGNTKVTDSVSSDFAMAKMGAKGHKEVDILLEDDVAKSLLLSIFPTELRARLQFTVIGSASALSRQLAADYLRQNDKPCLAIFDGDQLPLQSNNFNYAKKMLESENGEFDDWFAEHIAYLPGDIWPESWIIQKNQEAVESLAILVDADQDFLIEIMEYGLQAGKHNEFYEIAEHLGLSREQCLQLFTTNIKQHFEDEFTSLIEKIRSMLEA